MNEFDDNSDRGFRSRDSGPREMHTAVCSDCGKECQVPFKPTDGRPVYCGECFRKHKPPSRGGGSGGRFGGHRNDY
ncbi:MAG: CxxC-x17-CxxC domain-containing protein [Candidatus Micrarchaeia archaeon]